MVFSSRQALCWEKHPKFTPVIYLDVIGVDNERHEFLPVPGLAVVQDNQLGTGAHIDQGLLG